jgi:indolepyruvate ferredoxin oxidoreductase beta subunit
VTASLTGSDYDGLQALALLKENVNKLIVVDAGKIAASCGSVKVLNLRRF